MHFSQPTTSFHPQSQETLRLHSLVPVVSRICEKEDTLAGVQVPAQTKIMLNIKVCNQRRLSGRSFLRLLCDQPSRSAFLQATHLDPNNWPEPTVFRPERFAGEFNTYAFLPFIAGPRNCLGWFWIHLCLQHHVPPKLPASLTFFLFFFLLNPRPQVKI